MGTSAAYVVVPFDNGHTGALFHQPHGGTFTTRARANHYGIKLIVLLHVGETCFFIQDYNGILTS